VFVVSSSLNGDDRSIDGLREVSKRACPGGVV
jgi:hypothetical protein